MELKTKLGMDKRKYVIMNYLKQAGVDGAPYKHSVWVTQKWKLKKM